MGTNGKHRPGMTRKRAALWAAVLGAVATLATVLADLLRDGAG